VVRPVAGREDEYSEMVGEMQAEMPQYRFEPPADED
jgi:hypothetical protein